MILVLCKLDKNEALSICYTIMLKRFKFVLKPTQTFTVKSFLCTKISGMITYSCKNYYIYLMEKFDFSYKVSEKKIWDLVTSSILFYIELNFFVIILFKCDLRFHSTQVLSIYFWCTHDEISYFLEGFKISMSKYVFNY